MTTDEPFDHPDGTVEDRRTPRWVRLCGVAALLLVAVVLVVHLAGGGMGGHG